MAVVREIGVHQFFGIIDDADREYIYEMMEKLNPYSVDDLLKAHGVMTRELVEESGCFRSGPVGVVDKEGKVLHMVKV